MDLSTLTRLGIYRKTLFNGLVVGGHARPLMVWILQRRKERMIGTCPSQPPAGRIGGGRNALAYSYAEASRREFQRTN